VPELPGGTVTFVFTDIQDSTELLKRLGDEYRSVLTRHRRIGHLRGIDEPERVFEIAIGGLEVEPTEVPEPSAPTSPPAERELEQDIARRFDDLGARLAAGIQDRVLRSLEGKAGEAATGSAVDDIAARMELLGADIDVRVQAALAKKGIPPS